LTERNTESSDVSPEEARAIELLRYRNFSKVGRAVGVTRGQVAKWAQGKELTPYRLLQLEELLGRNEKNAPPPIGTERILTGVIALERRAEIKPEELAAAEAEALLLLKGLLEADETPLQR
jgi:transcriptional regulator with XRE-family HTH domain